MSATAAALPLQPAAMGKAASEGAEALDEDEKTPTIAQARTLAPCVGAFRAQRLRA